MSPLKIVANGKRKMISKKGGRIRTPDGIIVSYKGDITGETLLYLPGNESPLSFSFLHSGNQTEVNYNLLVRDCDGNYGPVERAIKLERY